MKFKSKILFVVPLPPPVHGSSMMCNYIKESNLINNNYDCDYVNLSTSRSIDEVEKFMFIKIWRLFTVYVKVLFKLLTNRYALCYVALAFHNALFKDALIVLLCKIFGRKIVIHLHGKGASEDAKGRIRKWLLDFTFRNTKVILLSWLLYDDIRRFVKREDVFICPNGIPIVNNELRTKESKTTRLLFLSNLVESKGVFVLLDALKMLRERGYSFICDFVGGESKEIDSKRFYEEVDKRELKKQVKYWGKKYGKDKYVMFGKADIFVYPTYCDCFPLVILEAMQFGLPVVTTIEGAICDFVENGKNGITIERKNSELFANSVAKLIEDTSLRKAMGEFGYTKFLENYSIEKFEKKLHGILDRIVGA